MLFKRKKKSLSAFLFRGEEFVRIRSFFFAPKGSCEATLFFLGYLVLVTLGVPVEVVGIIVVASPFADVGIGSR